MANNIWGQLGNLIFEFWKTPQVGSYYETKVSNFQQLDVYGITKNKKQASGHELTTISFSLKIPDIPFKIYETTAAERAFRATGASSIGIVTKESKEKRYGRFEGDSLSFEEEIERMQKSQDWFNFFIGDRYKGLYTINRIEKRYDFKPDGSAKIAIYNITLEEWIED